MAISIKGIRLKSLSINTKPENGESVVTCSYQLISSADKVLAEQEIGGYNGLKVAPSPATIKALYDFMKAYKNDVNMILGLDAE